MHRLLKSVASYVRKTSSRPLFRMTLGYLALAATIIPVGGVVFRALGLEWAVKFLILEVVFLFPLALILTWGLKITPEGPDTIPPAKTAAGFWVIVALVVGITLLAGGSWYWYTGPSKGETDKSNDLQGKISDLRQQLNNAKNDTAFVQVESDSSLAILRSQRRANDSLDSVVDRLKQRLARAKSASKRSPRSSDATVSRLRTKVSNLSGAATDLRQERENLKNRVSRLNEDKSTLKEKLSTANNRISDLSKSNKYNNVINTFSVYPSDIPQIEVGMSVSKSEEYLDGYDWELTSSWLSVNFSEGAFRRATYYHDKKGNNPTIEWVVYAFRDETASEAVSKQAICAFGGDKVKRTVQGKNLVWTDVNGYEIEIQNEGLTGHYKISK